MTGIYAVVLSAKARFDQHCATHKCKPLMMLGDGDAECGERRDLWLKYQGTAGVLL